MERLTFRGHKQNVLIKGSSCSYSWQSYDCQLEEGRDKLKTAFEKLAEYEGLEEQGLLLKLPCKVGQRVYEIYRFLDKGAWEIDIHKIKLEDLEKIGKTVFLTQAKAEEALKKMENGE